MSFFSHKYFNVSFWKMKTFSYLTMVRRSKPGNRRQQSSAIAPTGLAPISPAAPHCPLQQNAFHFSGPGSHISFSLPYLEPLRSPSLPFVNLTFRCGQTSYSAACLVIWLCLLSPGDASGAHLGRNATNAMSSSAHHPGRQMTTICLIAINVTFHHLVRMIPSGFSTAKLSFVSLLN